MKAYQLNLLACLLLFTAPFVSKEKSTKPAAEKQEIAILVTSNEAGEQFIQMSYDNRYWDECRIEGFLKDYLRNSCAEKRKESIQKL